MYRSCRGIVLVAAFLWLTGCASSSVFQAYPAQMEKVKQDLTSGQTTKIQVDLDGKRDSADKILHMMERGRVSQLAQDYDGSIQDFNVVIAAMDENEEKAKITATGAASQGSALLTNDNAIPYAGESYERVFVHNYQALNYVFKGDLDAAGVEVRRANLEQELALKRYEDEIDEATEDAESKEALDSNDYNAKLQSLSAVAGRVKNSFQNAYTFYISGLIYEAREEYDHAYIDYKRALEIFPDNEYLIADVVRLAKRLGMTDDFERLKDKVNPQLNNGPGNGESKVIVVYEHGFVPEKQEINFPFAFAGQIQNIVMPTYNDSGERVPPLRTTLAGQDVGETQPIVDVAALAAKALQERVPMVLVRQASRMLVRQQASDQTPGLLGAVMSVGHLLLNKADRRSWLTLPAAVQISYFYAPAGDQQLQLSTAGARESLPVSVVPGKMTLVYVYHVNGRLSASTINI